MNSKAAAKAAKVAAAKKEVEGFKVKLASAKAKLLKASKEKKAGFEGMEKVSTTQGKATDGFEQLKVRRRLEGHFGKVYSLHWGGNGTDLVSASQDGKLMLWNALKNAKLQAIPLRSAWVMGCAIEQEAGTLVATGGLDNLCSIYRPHEPNVMRPHRELTGHDGYISSCRFIDEGSIISASGDKTCMLWDVELGQRRHTFADHDGDVMSVSVLPAIDRNVFVSGSCDKTAKVWDIRTGKCTMTLRGHESDINSVCMFPDGKAIGTGSDDSSCKVFDMRAVDELVSFRNPDVLCGATSVDFSKSGRVMFAGYDDYNCRAWDTLGSAGKCLYTLGGHEDHVSCVGVAPNGDALCTGSWDMMLKVWA
jgi:guanine nucleotide-binding protein G(I)/G(S)/G(T) subunit beta-1